MALNDVERKVLVAARQAIRAGRRHALCDAIYHARVERAGREELSIAKDRLYRYIRFSLGSYSTLGAWQYSRTGSWMPHELLREARIAWITWMLDEPLDVGSTTYARFYRYMGIHRFRFETPRFAV